MCSSGEEYFAELKADNLVRRLFADCEEKVTLHVEGLSFDMPESLFAERTGRFRERRLPLGHSGIVAISVIYFDREETKGGGKGKKRQGREG